jgi:uncharacterized protein
VTFFNLRTLRLRSGEEFRDEQEVGLEPFELGGERYVPVPEKVKAELAITQASTGTVFELRFRAALYGPCQRCLGEATVERSISAREYQANRPDSDELRSPYVVEDRLDLSAWARDALALELPEQILCREACAGLCPTCGKDLNVEPHEHTEREPDPRWAALVELRDEL